MNADACPLPKETVEARVDDVASHAATGCVKCLLLSGIATKLQDQNPGFKANLFSPFPLPLIHGLDACGYRGFHLFQSESMTVLPTDATLT
jgi:hypothetical protein